MQSVDNTIKSKITGHGRGWCMTAADFWGAGSESAVRQVLSRLQRKGMIRRLSQGLYDYPVKDVSLGVIPPDHDMVAKAIVGKDNVRIQPSGAYTANLLGLDAQVPSRIVFLTDGISKKMKIGNTIYSFRRTTPKNMMLAGTEMGLVIQALRHIKENNITPRMDAILKKHLQKIGRDEVERAMKCAPIWIRVLIRRLGSTL